MIFDYLDFLDGLPERARVCAVYGSSDLDVDPNVFPLRAIAADGDLDSGPTQLCGIVVCRECAAIRLHAIRPAN